MTLGIDPSAKEVTGEGEIDLVRDVGSAPPLYLHGEKLRIESAVFVPAAPGAPAIPLSTTELPDGMLAFLPLDATRTLPAGRGTLRLRWRAPLVRDDAKGAFVQELDGVPYAFSQFEPLGARRVFPCFDEPAFKVPWQLTLLVPRGLVALSNTPVAAERDDGLLHRVEFAPTPALPSYLVAFAVGPFEMLDAGKTAAGAPIRVAVPRGHAEEAAIPVEDTAPLLARLEDYFGTPYPFAKLDLVPIPDTAWFSAMENPGLITYYAPILLTKPADRTYLDRRVYALTAAHEMAHQWFGDLVTMAWWDDTWLNEGFAAWMSTRIVAAWKPEWHEDLRAVVSRTRVMTIDSRAASRRVREPADDWNGFEDAFDGITYTKGQAVIAMIERWVGPEVFQKGIRLDLARHARGNARYDDLVAALGEASGRDVGLVFGDFVNRTGVPYVDFSLVCEAGHKPRLELRQERFVPLGSTLDRGRTWHVPISVRWQAGRASGRAQTVLEGTTGHLELDAPACPDWVMPQDGATGYYRWKLAGAPFERLRSARVLRSLPAAERLEVASSIGALVSAGELPYRRSVEMAMALADDPERQVRELAIAAGSGWEDWLAPDLLPTYRAWVRKTFGRATQKAGLTPRPGESEDERMLRGRLLRRMVDDGNDPALSGEVTARAWKWLDDRTSLAPELVDTVLDLAALRGDARLHDRYLAEARKANAAHDQAARVRFIQALASFRDLELARRSRELVLGDELPILESYRLLWAGTDTRAGQKEAFDFLVAHYDAIMARLPAEMRVNLLSVGSTCEAAGLARAKEFFAARVPREVSGPRAYASFVEREELCIARHSADLDSFVAFLRENR
jgi:alanyl aminopeptidase